MTNKSVSSSAITVALRTESSLIRAISPKLFPASTSNGGIITHSPSETETFVQRLPIVFLPATFVQRLRNVFQTAWTFGTRWVVVVFVCTTTTQRVPNVHFVQRLPNVFQTSWT